MKLLVAVCFVLCLGAAYSQVLDLDEHPALTPVSPLNFCRRRTWGWFSTTFQTLTPQTNGNTQTFYFDCRISRPRWSECRGGCSSYDRLGAQIPPWNWNRACFCCRAHRIQVVTPRAYCRFIFTFVNGCPQPVDDGYVSHPTLNSYRYYLMDQCRCAACTGQGNEDAAEGENRTGLPEVEADQDDIADRQEPSVNRRISRGEIDRYEQSIPESAKRCQVRETVEAVDLTRFIRRT